MDNPSKSEENDPPVTRRLATGLKRLQSVFHRGLLGAVEDVCCERFGDIFHCATDAFPKASAAAAAAAIGICDNRQS